MEPMTESAPPVRRIVLTGFMGSGKSTVGPLLARHLGWKFLDVDEVIESESGQTISSIFAECGETAFRDLEAATIARLANDDGLVLALGGGAIEHVGTRELLLLTPGTMLVHLEVRLSTTLTRCKGTENTRPILADQAHLTARYNQRLPLYRLAHANIHADWLRPKQVMRAVLDAAGLT